MAWINENILISVRTIGPWDVLDILLLASVFYFLVRFARKRRATKLVLGVVLFLLIMFLVDAIHLTALNFVFGDFKQLGVLAIVILFQPEIRSALEKIGNSTTTGLQNVNSNDKNKKDENSFYVIESVSRAAQQLSNISHGALIVIERSNDLSDLKKNSAVTLDAVVSPDILCSIFYKGGALHDGAVLISEGKVEAARCVLPMTESPDLDGSLGTRHRAAIGLTETSDAIVVVVSEETGTISLSIGGELERGFDYDTLRERLEEVLLGKKRRNTKGSRKNNRNKNKILNSLNSLNNNQNNQQV